MKLSIKGLVVGLAVGLGPMIAKLLSAEDVGIGKRFRRLPPSKVAVGHKIKRRDQCQLDRNKQVAAQRSAKDSRRRRGLPRP